MAIVFYLLNLSLQAFDLFLIARAICSWIPSSRDSMIYRICYTVTEPILRPIRDLLFRFEWARRCPIDLSFIVVILLINALTGATGVLMDMFL